MYAWIAPPFFLGGWAVAVLVAAVLIRFAVGRMAGFRPTWWRSAAGPAASVVVVLAAVLSSDGDGSDGAVAAMVAGVAAGPVVCCIVSRLVVRRGDRRLTWLQAAGLSLVGGFAAPVGVAGTVAGCVTVAAISQ